MYDTSRFAEEERGLSDRHLARSMVTNSRDIDAEERKARLLGKREEQEDAKRFGKTNVGFFESEEEDSDY